MNKCAFLLFIVFNFSQVTAQDVFQKYQKNPDASYLSVSPKMFEMLGKLSINTGDPIMDGFIEMVKSMKHFRVLSTKNLSIAQEMETWLKDQLAQTDLESVMNISEQEVEVQFCVVYGSDDSRVDRLVMYVSGAQKIADQEGLELSNLDFILLSIEGNIDLEQVAVLTEIIDIPGGNFLKKINTACRHLWRLFPGLDELGNNH